jgi:hypothetical protein
MATISEYNGIDTLHFELKQQQLNCGLQMKATQNTIVGKKELSECLQ